MSAALLSICPAAAQEEAAPEKKPEVMVIETEIGMDQILPAAPMIKPPKNEQARSEEESAGEEAAPRHKLSEERIVQLNSSLRKAIEENKRMRERNQQLLDEMRRMRGQMTFDSTRINRLTAERNTYKNQSEEIVELNENVQRRLRELQLQVETRERIYEQRIVELQKELEAKEEELVVASTPAYQIEGLDRASADRLKASAAEEILRDQREGAAVMTLIDEIAAQNKQLKQDEGRIHYNMGNVYFSQGDYEKAVAEYQQAVDLLPEDADAHFNLAFVNGEYMRNYKKAWEHYQQYLHLNPGAPDARLVREKILEAELNLRATIDSKLEKDWQEHKHGQRVP